MVTVTEPGVPDMFPDVPVEAPAPVATMILLPAVASERLPFVAVRFPVVAVTPVPPVTVPLAETFPAEAAMLPVVAVMPVPPVKVVVEAMEPGAMKVAGIVNVTVDPEAAVVISLAVPASLILPAEGVAVPLSPVREKRSPVLAANSSHVAVPPVLEMRI